jgi:septum formation protein
MLMLTAAGITFTTCSPDVDESEIKSAMQASGTGPRELARALATAKALDVSCRFPEALVLGGDSIASVQGRCFDKPCSRENAVEHLRAFSGKMMTLDSAAVLARGGELVDWRSDDAHLEFRHLSAAFIKEYLDHEWPAISGCVGCFRIEARGVQLFEVVTGSHFTVLGMPLLPVLEMLRQHGLIPA